MPDIRILSETELRGVISLDLEAVACVENAFRALAGGAVVMPPIMRLDIHDANGEIDVKSAYVPGLDSFAVKMSSGFFDNPGRGLLSGSGLMVLFSATTGLVEAVLLDNGYLTDVRTAAAGAVAAKHLSRENSRRAAILGAGLHARLQLKALTLVRPIEAACIWGRNPAAATAAANEMTAELGLPVTTAETAAGAVAGADIIVTTTPSATPLLQASWLEPGQHVTAMGSDAEHKNELDPAAIARADLYVADSLAQTRHLGELHHAIAAGLAAADAPYPELGQVIAGAPGRSSPSQITICDLTGTGVQDTAIATLAQKRATAHGAGVAFAS
jgi:ornithine cyclodeaminase